jgi:antiviral helicase SKI2
MSTGDIDAQLKAIYYKMSQLQTEMDNASNFAMNLRTPRHIIEEYLGLQKNSDMFSNKRKKEVERAGKSLEEDYKFLKQDIISYTKIYEKEKEIDVLQKEMDQLNLYFQSGVERVLELLREEDFIKDQNTLTLKGKIAAQIREIHCLVFANMIYKNQFDNLSSKQLVALFSCFTNINVQEDRKAFFPKSEDTSVEEIVKLVAEAYNSCQDIELKRNIVSGMDYNVHYDLLNYVEEWCDTTDVETCKLLLQKIGEEKEIFLGEFVKALLKINNISCEMEKIAEMTGNIALLSKLREIPNMTMKYVVTNQSLYV